MKKLISFILAISILFTFGSISLTANAYSLHDCPTTLGDLDGDGKVSAKDSLFIMQFTIKRITCNPNQKKCADVNGDNKVTNADALLCLRHSIGLSTNGISFLKDVRTGTEFSAYAGSYYFQVGVGNRYVKIDLNSDGTFTGAYSDTNLGESGSGYNFTTYYNEFSGSFDGPHSTGTYEYGTYVKNFKLKYKVGSSAIKTDEYGQKIRYVYSTPSGIAQRDYFRLFIQGTPTSALPDDFTNYVMYLSDNYLPYHAFYNVTGHSVFQKSNY